MKKKKITRKELLAIYAKKDFKFNLGSGEDLRDDYINIDIREIEGLDICGDIRSLDFIPNDCAKEILCYDVLEHFSFHETRDVLTHWINKLRPGGQIIVRVPDLEKILDRFVNGDLPAFEAQRLVFGGQDYPENFHSAGFTEGMLEGYLLGCGCREVIQVVREEDTHNVTLVARK
jgi:predicted SAM-dependent methyltransferase